MTYTILAASAFGHKLIRDPVLQTFHTNINYVLTTRISEVLLRNLNQCSLSVYGTRQAQFIDLNDSCEILQID